MDFQRTHQFPAMKICCSPSQLTGTTTIFEIARQLYKKAPCPQWIGIYDQSLPESEFGTTSRKIVIKLSILRNLESRIMNPQIRSQTSSPYSRSDDNIQGTKRKCALARPSTIHLIESLNW